jgi:hypothetical protein
MQVPLQAWPAGAPKYRERKSKNNKIVARVVSDGSSHEKDHVCGYIEDGLRGGVEFICPVLTEPAPKPMGNEWPTKARPPEGWEERAGRR